MRKQWLAILLIVISTCFIFIFTSRRIFLQKQWFFRTFQAFTGSPKTNVRAFFPRCFCSHIWGRTYSSFRKNYKTFAWINKIHAKTVLSLWYIELHFPYISQSLRDNNKDKLCCSYNSKYLCHNTGKSQGAKIEHAHRQDMQVSLKLIQGQVGCRRY